MWWKIGLLRNPEASKQWLGPRQPAKVIVKNRLGKKLKLCVWSNFEGVIQWELVPNGRASLYLRIFIINNWNEFMKFRDGDTQHYLTEIEFSFSRAMRDPMLHEQPWQKFRNWFELNCYNIQLQPWSCAFRLPSVSILGPFLAWRNFENIEVWKLISPNSSHQKAGTGTVAG